MRIAVFSSQSYTAPSFERANGEFQHELVFFEPRLNAQTVPLAHGYPAVCAFVNDELDATVLHELARHGTRLIALRCAGFNNVDLIAADQLGLVVTRVPAYSPHAVAEHAVALMLALNRKLHRAYARVREGNFSLDGLVGFDMRGRTVGIVGTGRIGQVVAEILRGFGCQLLGYDAYPSEACQRLGVEYVLLPELWARSDIVTLHCPLTLSTHHLLDAKALAQMRDGVMLINTPHQAFLTEHALTAIARTTLDDVARFERKEPAANRAGVEQVLHA